MQPPIPEIPEGNSPRYAKEVLELYTKSAYQGLTQSDWGNLLQSQHCEYLGRKCLKMRKSAPDITLGTCTVGYKGNAIVICPYRFLQGMQIFRDVIPLLEGHEASNQIHVVSEVEIPGGNVDFFVVSSKDGTIQDYLALEIQALDTTGSWWPARQAFIKKHVDPTQTVEAKSFGMNWRMTAKTILVQMHHKAQTLDTLGKKLVLVVQDCLYTYMSAEFNTSRVRAAERADSVHFQVYSVNRRDHGRFGMTLRSHYSTTPAGIEVMLGASRSNEISESDMRARLKLKMNAHTLLGGGFHPQDVVPQIETRIETSEPAEV